MTDVEKGRVFGWWWGGDSYAMSDVWEFLEQFKDVESAMEALRERYANGHWCLQDFEYVNRDPESVRTSAVNEKCAMHLFYAMPENGDYYPDAILKLRFSAEDEVEVYVESV